MPKQNTVYRVIFALCSFCPAFFLPCVLFALRSFCPCSFCPVFFLPHVIFALCSFCPVFFLPHVIFAPCSFCPFTKANYFALSSIHPNMVACVLHKYHTVKRNHPASFRSLKGHDSSITLSTSKHALVSLL